MADSGAGCKRSGFCAVLLMALLELLALCSCRVIPGVQAVAFGQLAQMFGHFEERGIAFLSCPHSDDLAGVLPRPRHGCLPG